MGFDIIFQLVSGAIIAATFYILAAALKDSRLKREHPFLSSKVMKLALSGILVSQFGTLLLPMAANLFWVLFNTSVMAVILVLADRYRRRFASVGIEFVDSSVFLAVPSDHYVESEPGVYLRHYDFDGVALVPSELELIEICKQYDPAKNMAIFFRIKAGASFPDHFHKNQENTHFRKGLAYMKKGFPPIAAGESIHIPAGEVHRLDAIEYCEGVCLIGK